MPDETRTQDPSATDEGDKGQTIWTVAVALGVNLLLAAAKLVAGLLSGSPALLSEAAHSLADSLNEVFLAAAVTRSQRRADARHPFGYGKERYFWSMLAAVGIFITGGCFSFYQALTTFLHPEETELATAWVGLVVLGIAIVAEGSSLVRAVYQVHRAGQEKGVGLRRELRSVAGGEGDPALRTVLAEDSVAVLGAGVAAVGMSLHLVTGNAVYEAVAALLIGLLLVWTAYRLGRDAKDLLVGESASAPQRLEAWEFLESQPEIDVVLEVLTMRLGPETAMLAARVDLTGGIDSERVEVVSGRIKSSLTARFPHFDPVFIDISDATPEGARQARQHHSDLREQGAEEESASAT